MSRELGERRSIPRRDFLQGALVASATRLGGPLLDAYGAAGSNGSGATAAQDRPGYYPPLLNGMRGSHPGSFEPAHALRDGAAVGRAIDTGESYDLVVVGAGYPLPARAREDILRIEAGAVDFMPGLSSADKKLRLSKMSYRDFLRDVVKVDAATLTFYQTRTHSLWGVGIDAVSALDCWGVEVPGFKGMKLAPGAIPRKGFTPAGFADTGGSKTFHFPDGNASIARLLARNLLPDAVPGHTAEDVVTARVAYDRSTAAVGAGARAVWADCHREFGFGWWCLSGCGDRSGGSGGQGSVAVLKGAACAYAGQGS